MTPKQIVDFWLHDVGPARWYVKDSALDAEIAAKLGDLHEAARDGRLDEWRNDAEGSLALLILLDQVPRNIFRGDARAFATDGRARDVAYDSVAAGYDIAIAGPMRIFFYLPFMHSENLNDQNRSVELIAERIGVDSENHAFALKHREVIARFGRFPGRNAALNRSSTSEEQAFLASNPGF
ncbi:MAG: DUF924 family protein [Alphaproteobacteria bacterium]|nr:DUF924 family protein [Alphaproteobacteria bacterium]